MNSDCYFWIGSTHDICEDYAIAGKWNDGEHYAIVSDGCSSSHRTDWGSRILADAAEYYLNNNVVGPSMAGDIIRLARWRAIGLMLPNDSLDATLLIATSREAYCFGDGSIAIMYDDGRIDLTTIDFPSGAPLYLNYIGMPERYAEYCRVYGTKRNIISSSISKDGLVRFSCKEQDDLDFGVRVCVPDDAIAVAVMTDGISSFMEEVGSDTSREERQLDVATVAQRLLNFKNYNGVFTKRRARRFIKDCHNWQWQNVDDVSLGAIYIGK